jgi:hypothetical protein
MADEAEPVVDETTNDRTRRRLTLARSNRRPDEKPNPVRRTRRCRRCSRSSATSPGNSRRLTEKKDKGDGPLSEADKAKLARPSSG